RRQAAAGHAALDETLARDARTGRGATLTTVRDNLLHVSISTTSIYLDDDESQRTQQIQRIFIRRSSA
ncbi:hypothetical protein WM40_26625, partial [Robbsia andropogonis]